LYYACHPDYSAAANANGSGPISRSGALKAAGLTVELGVHFLVVCFGLAGIIIVGALGAIEPSETASVPLTINFSPGLCIRIAAWVIGSCQICLEIRKPWEFHIKQ